MNFLLGVKLGDICVFPHADCGNVLLSTFFWVKLHIFLENTDLGNILQGWKSGKHAVVG